MKIEYEDLKVGYIYKTFLDRIFLVDNIIDCGYIYSSRLLGTPKSGADNLILSLTEKQVDRFEIEYLGLYSEMLITDPELFI